MKKAWVHKRKNRAGWYVDWIVNRKRHQKKCPNKSLADKFASRIIQQLNTDVYVEPIKELWDKATSEYINYKKYVRGLTPASIRSIQSSLDHFKKINGPVKSSEIDQQHIHKLIEDRRKSAQNPTINKDLRNIRAFLNWLKKNRYNTKHFDWEMLKEDSKDAISLTAGQVSDLTAACWRVHVFDRWKKPTNFQWYIRILLAVTTGLRKEDIESLCISNIDFESGTVQTFSHKTRKHSSRRPLHSLVMPALSRYHALIPPGQKNLFSDKFTSDKWDRIRKAAGLPDLHFHHLRHAFASFVAQAGFSTSVAQHLLEHSTPNLTNRVYINVDRKFKDAVESIPIGQAIIDPDQSE